MINKDELVPIKIVQNKHIGGDLNIDKILPNTLCEKTKNLEKKFLQNFNIQPYKYEEDNLSTVLYSRTLDTHYLWPLDQPLTVNHLKDYFSESGHTLGVSNKLNYCRMFALDLDCLCRVQQKKQKINAVTASSSSCMEHLTENDMLKISEFILEKLTKLFNIKNILISTWRNKCGCHIYTNLNVSLPTHLYLKMLIQSEIEKQYTMLPVIFEVPTIMPLPYSSKELNQPYKPININNIFNSLALTTIKKSCYTELFEYTKLCTNHQTIATLETMNDKQYMNILDNFKLRDNLTRFNQVTMIQLNESYEYMKPLSEHINHVVNAYNKTYKINNISLDDISDDIKMKIQVFMSKFNNLFYKTAVADISTCSYFVELSLNESNGLYLQHFIAALHISLDLIDIEKFRNIIDVIYDTKKEQYKIIQPFIKYYCMDITKCYIDTAESILDHLYYLISNKVNPLDSLNEQINQILRNHYTQYNPDSTSTSIINILASIKEQDKKIVIINGVLDTFADIIKKLRIVYYNNRVEAYYVLQNDCESYSMKKLNEKLKQAHLPTVLRSWIGSDVFTTKCILQHIEVNVDKYVLPYPEFPESKFMFSTKVGVFNSALGLYTAKTALLKFTKSRSYGVWDIKKPLKMYDEQNNDVMKKLEIVKRIVLYFHKNISNIYMHYILIPAILQLPYIGKLQNVDISRLFKRLTDFDNFKEAYFLVEYYPFDPKIVNAMLYLYYKCESFDILSSYHKLCKLIFGTTYISEEDWKKKFNEWNTNLKYDDTKKTHLEKLLSIESNVEEVNHNACFCITLYIACIMKCPNFQPIIDAFNIKLENVTYQHPEYHDMLYKTNLNEFKLNYNRTIRILFGKELSEFEMSIIDECFSLSASANFHPETTVNLFDCLSLIFIPYNVLKKIIIFYGPGDCGKTFLTNKLRILTEPHYGSHRDLTTVFTRSSVTLDYNLTVLTEFSEISPALLRSITGNDAESTMQFYSQKYVTQKSQSLLFAATNTPIKFSGGNTYDIDRTLINRLHVVEVKGVHCPPTTVFDSLFTMLTQTTYFMGVKDRKDVDSANALAWAMYSSYLLRRKETLDPILSDNEDTINYQNIVYYNNSKIYRFLAHCGITEKKNTYMKTSTLYDVVKYYIDKNDRGDSFDSIEKFKRAFNKHYKISLDNNNVLYNFQQKCLIEHINRNMSVVEVENKNITATELENRLSCIYTDIVEQNNARAYFQHKNIQKYYDFKTETYIGIAFQYESISYEDNRINSYEIPNIENSLVYQQIN